MVWGCVSSSGVGDLVFIDGNMDRFQYLQILKTHLKQSARKLNIESTFKYYQDNDPKHTSRLVQEWLLYNCPKIIQTPAQSPDLNPIENLCDKLDRRIHKTPISNLSQLKNRLITEWNSISTEYTAKIVNNMPDRLHAVLRNKGYATRY